MPEKQARTTSTWTIGRLIADVLEPLAPLHLAESWDNVGLLAGDTSMPCTGVLLCIDLTDKVIAEANKHKTNLVLAYHPILFKPVSRVVACSTGTDRLIWLAANRGLSVYSPHTALDAARGGTNDVLAEICGLTDIEPLEYVPSGLARKKMVVFVPPERVDLVAEVMFRAGAGHIGDYEKCSYRLSGEGTFFGTEGTNPAVGRKGRLERVPEIRLECIVPGDCVGRVIQAMRAAHPYEEPAFDVYPLESEPVMGIGRRGRLKTPETLADLAARLGRAVEARSVQTVGPPGRRVSRVAICVGAAGLTTLEGPGSRGIDATITGEIRHHYALAYLRQGQGAIALGHWASERPVLARLRKRIQAAARAVPVRISRADCDPFKSIGP